MRALEGLERERQKMLTYQDSLKTDVTACICEDCLFAMLNLRDDGASNEQIAEQFGLHPDVVAMAFNQIDADYEASERPVV